MLAITDHWRRTDAESTELLVLAELGAELHPPGRPRRPRARLRDRADADPAPLGAEYADLARTAGFIEEHGGVAYLAHPYWSGATPGRLELPANVYGIEVFNAGCELEIGRGLSSVHWDELLEAGRRCFAIATDDSHHPGFDSDLAWTWIRVAEPHARRRARGARARARSTRAPARSLHGVELDGDEVEVRCSPCRSVTLVGGTHARALP